MKNHLWNMFANIKNGQLAKRAYVVVHTKKKLCESFLNVLWDEGFILGYKKLKNSLKIFLKYQTGVPVINTLKCISTPGRRIYFTVKQLWKIDSSKTFLILSTNRGLMTLVKCKKFNLGGEPLIVIN